MSRKGIMLAYPFEEKRLLKWTPPYIVQPKLDGVRCRAIPTPTWLDWQGYELVSSEENKILSVPHITDALNKSGLWPKELDGELYRHGLPFEEIFSRTSRTATIHSGYEDIQYHIFDYISSEPQARRTLEIGSFKDPLIRVPYHLAYDLNSLMKIYDEFLNEGYEGIIVRHIKAPYMRKRSLYMMKFKPKKDDYYTIVGWREEVSIHGEYKSRLGALECVSDGGQTFTVGSGLKDDDRVRLWEIRDTLPGKLCHVQYQHITPGRGVPRFPVFYEIIDTEPKEVIIGESKT